MKKCAPKKLRYQTGGPADPPTKKEPTAENFKILADNLNKLAGVAPVVLGSQNKEEMKPKKYATGGTYQPVGLPVDPSLLRQQKIDNRKAEKQEFWKGLGTVASFAAPIVAGPLGGMAAGMMNRAINTPLPQTPDVNMVDNRTNMYEDQTARPMYANTGGPIEDAVQFEKAWAASPMFRKMNLKSTNEYVKNHLLDTKDLLEFENYVTTRNQIPSKVPIKVDPKSKSSYYKKDPIFKDRGSITIGKNNRGVSNDDVATHELSHAVDHMTGQWGSPNFIDSKKDRLLGIYGRFVNEDLDILDDFGLNHDADPGEYKADIKALRYILAKNKIYDPLNQELTPTQWNKALSNPRVKNNEIYKRLVKKSQKGNDSILEALNTITYTDKNSETVNASTGGDLGLSSTGFQVKGNPNTTDGNHYPHLNANLDHNEVVSNSVTDTPFIFSDDLKVGKHSFAAMAKRLEAAKGKAEKILKSTPYDQMSKNTVMMSDKALEDLATQQEELATNMGHRNPDGSTKQPNQYRTGGLLNFATGGPGDPPNNKRYMEVDKKYNIYYDPYEDKIVRRLKDGRYILHSEGSFDGSNFQGQYRKPAPEVIKQHLMLYPEKSEGKFAGKTAEPAKVDTVERDARQRMTELQFPRPPQPPVNTVAGYLDSQWNLPREGNQPVTSETDAPQSAPETKQLPTNSNRTSAPSTRSNKVAATQTNRATVTPPIAPDSRRSTYQPAPISRPGMMQLPDGTWVPEQVIPTAARNNELSMDQRAEIVNRPPTIVGYSPYRNTQSDIDVYRNEMANTMGSESNINQQDYTTPFTVGDAMQAASVVSKFGLIGSNEVEQANVDSTNITKESYDVTPQLQQSQRNFRNYRNSLTGSINTRRAMAGAGYANKLNADSNIIDQYHNMNNQANTQYEQRVADQRRYNIGQINYTNDINARNRGQRKTLMGNAWDSVSNFGTQLNTKVYANDAMSLLQTMFPDVYEDAPTALNRNRSLKLTRRNGK